MSDLIKPDLNKPMFKMFPTHRLRIEKGICPICSKIIKVNDFRDEPSKTEYSISGLCQNCQDEVFGVD